MTEANSTASIEHSHATTKPTTERDWAFYPTLPTIREESNNEQRIVGGNEATPGEIPWQVRGRVFMSLWELHGKRTETIIQLS